MAAYFETSLFPAYAGVILTSPVSVLYWMPFPRLRGGDPYFGMRDNVEVTFSPPTRG